jgi:hypothetical protein
LLLCYVRENDPSWNAADVVTVIEVTNLTIEQFKKKLVDDGIETAFYRKQREKPPVFEVYHLPYDPKYPMVCMDESSKQIIGEVLEPIPYGPGRPARMDDEYISNDVAVIFIEVEPFAGKRHMMIFECRTKKDWALQIKRMLDEQTTQMRSKCGWSWILTTLPLSMKHLNPWKPDVWQN